MYHRLLTTQKRLRLCSLQWRKNMSVIEFWGRKELRVTVLAQGTWMISSVMKISLNCTAFIKYLWRLHEWTAISLKYLFTSCTLCQWRIPAQTCVSMFEYQGTVPTPRRYPETRYCVLRWIKRIDTCYRMGQFNPKLLPNGTIDTQHSTFKVVCPPLVVKSVLSSHYMHVIQFRSNVLPGIITWLQLLKSLMIISPHLTPLTDTVKCHIFETDAAL